MKQEDYLKKRKIQKITVGQLTFFAYGSYDDELDCVIFSTLDFTDACDAFEIAMGKAKRMINRIQRGRL